MVTLIIYLTIFLGIVWILNEILEIFMSGVDVFIKYPFLLIPLVIIIFFLRRRKKKKREQEEFEIFEEETRYDFKQKKLEELYYYSEFKKVTVLDRITDEGLEIYRDVERWFFPYRTKIRINHNGDYVDLKPIQEVEDYLDSLDYTQFYKLYKD